MHKKFNRWNIHLSPDFQLPEWNQYIFFFNYKMNRRAFTPLVFFDLMYKIIFFRKCQIMTIFENEIQAPTSSFPLISIVNFLTKSLIVPQQRSLESWWPLTRKSPSLYNWNPRCFFVVSPLLLLIKILHCKYIKKQNCINLKATFEILKFKFFPYVC